MIDNKHLEEAEKRVLQKHYALNYPNTYVEYLNITRDENNARGLMACLRSLLRREAKVIVPEERYSQEEYRKELSGICYEVKSINEIYYRLGNGTQERRSLIIEGIKDAIRQRYTESGIPYSEIAHQYTPIEERSSESDVFVDEANDIVWKVKDIFAHDTSKPHNPWDCFYEYIATNLLFPNVPMTFHGYSDRRGEPALLFSQPYIRDMRCATEKEVLSYMTQMGLYKTNKYNYRNDYFIITDILGKNVLSDGKGTLYFIDPNIYFLKPWDEVQAYLLESRNI